MLWSLYTARPFQPSSLPAFLHYTSCHVLQFSSVAPSCPTLWDHMDCSTPGLPVHHQLLEFTQTHVHWASDAIQPSHPLSSPSPPAFNLSQHQSLFQWVSSSHQVAKGLEFQHGWLISLETDPHQNVISLGQRSCLPCSRFLPRPSELLLLLLSRVNHVQLRTTPWTAAHQVPPSLGFSRQEHWSGLPFLLQPSEQVLHKYLSLLNGWIDGCAYVPAQSCLTLCDPSDCNLQGSSVHGILQARILVWVAMPSSRGSSWPRDLTHILYIPCIGSPVLYHLGSQYRWMDEPITRCVSGAIFNETQSGQSHGNM